MGYGLGVLYIFLTAVHSSALGALLTVAPSLWYDDYTRQALAWRDGRAGGPAARRSVDVDSRAIFIVFGLALFAAWLGEAERRVRFTATDTASRTVLIVVLICGLAASACGSAGVAEAEAITGGDVSRGPAALGTYGCGACHTIPGLQGANATVGPPLERIAVRQYLGGHVINTPVSMITRIQHPQSVDPKNVMPDLGVTDQDARDIAAFLYTLR